MRHLFLIRALARNRTAARLKYKLKCISLPAARNPWIDRNEGWCERDVRWCWLMPNIDRRLWHCLAKHFHFHDLVDIWRLTVGCGPCPPIAAPSHRWARGRSLQKSGFSQQCWEMLQRECYLCSIIMFPCFLYQDVWMFLLKAHLLRQITY